VVTILGGVTYLIQLDPVTYRDGEMVRYVRYYKITYATGYGWQTLGEERISSSVDAAQVLDTLPAQLLYFRLGGGPARDDTSDTP
jgi:hypothetical protein